MKQYLLDTNIIVFLFKNQFDIAAKIDSIGWENIFISEITLIELQYGALKSGRPAHHLSVLQTFVEQIEVLPIYSAIFFFNVRRKLSKI